jgi:hypothetical protein
MNMITKLTLSAVIAASVVSLPSKPAFANVDMDVRCNNDSLDPTAARARLEWARYCGLKVNVVSPSPANPLKREDTQMIASNGGTLIEFYEDFASSNFWGLNTYTSVSVGYQINTTHISKQYLNGVTSQLIDAQGFEKWSRPANKALARPMYPTFGTSPDASSGAPLYPNSATATDCKLYFNKNATSPAANFYVVGYCTSSCYTPEQQVLFPEGYKPILDAVTELQPTVMTLSSSSTLGDLSLQPNNVASYTKELWDTDHVIYEIRTDSGGLLRVTDEHPVIRGEGRIVQAKHLRVGDELVKINGRRDSIESIEVVSHFGKVYNLKPAARDRVSNILVAQGYLVGSSAFQNEDVDYINRIILGRSIPEDVIPR